MHFMEYRVPAAMEQIRQILAIPAKRADTRLVRHLSVDEIQSLLNAPTPTSRDGLRDRAMLHLCFAGGLRVSELIGLQLASVTLHPHASVLVHGKGRRERCLPLWKETTAALRAWLAASATTSTALVPVHVIAEAPPSPWDFAPKYLQKTILSLVLQ